MLLSIVIKNVSNFIWMQRIKRNTTLTIHLPSSFIIVIVLSLGLPTVTLVSDIEDELTVRVKFSSLSNTLSLTIETSNEAVVLPTRKVTGYGPDI